MSRSDHGATLATDERPNVEPAGGSLLMGRRGLRRLMAAVAVTALAAVTGAGAALAVARATGWGTTTVEHRYVAGSAPLSESAANVGAVLARVLPSAVSVTATWTVDNPFFPGATRTVTASGTGVVVSAGGEVVTNAHVVAGAASISVTVDAARTTYPARLLGAHPSADLALIAIDATGLRLAPASFADSGRVAVGDGVIAIGYALGLAGGPTVTAGIVSATGRSVPTRSSDGAPVMLTGMLQTDAAISSGNSGGPLVNNQGEVVGINTVVATSTTDRTATDIGFSIPAGRVIAELSDLRRTAS